MDRAALRSKESLSFRLRLGSFLDQNGLNCGRHTRTCGGSNRPGTQSALKISKRWRISLVSSYWRFQSHFQSRDNFFQFLNSLKSRFPFHCHCSCRHLSSWKMVATFFISLDFVVQEAIVNAQTKKATLAMGRPLL